jgi:hypothetical protein
MRVRANWLFQDEAFMLGNADGETTVGAAWVC